MLSSKSERMSNRVRKDEDCSPTNPRFGLQRKYLIVMQPRLINETFEALASLCIQ